MSMSVPASQVNLGDGKAPILAVYSLLVVFMVCVLSLPQVAAAADTERLMLSGESIEDAVSWEFFCSGGRRSGEWTEIPVPSHWEQHGFGSYNYGHDDDPSREQGIYRHRFQVPTAWQGRRIEVVFDGVMTDAEVEINGLSAGAVHRGAFYSFRYEISSLLKFGEENVLEVTVSKHSSDKRVNGAERDADYWIFGGIFRPVYLEAKGEESIERWAVDGRHDGQLTVDVFLHPPRASSELVWSVTDLQGQSVGDERRQTVEAGQDQVRLAGSFPRARPWSAEEPHLHILHLRLERQAEVLHRVEGRFGFRTFEVHRQEGLLVNGRPVRLKGINRHVFWPSSGRASWPRRDRLDVERLKALNLNAVRTAHYPPDRAFLDACDELGLYVLDELGGWHDAYGTTLGRQLVREMVIRDVNHPSILFWDNGNEGGWNKALDSEFARWDPQHRPVLHPDELLGDIETQHYPNWEELSEVLDEATWRNRLWGLRAIEPPLVMPTELLHGLYDGGSGAGLEIFWRRLSDHPLGVGAFLWSFTDESIERTDQAGALDSDDNHAPDGVLGPYREWSGTASTVREVFTPIAVEGPDLASFKGVLRVHNRFDHLDLSECHFEWQLLDLPTVGEQGGPKLVSWGKAPGPSVEPGKNGTLDLELSTQVVPPTVDALRLTAVDPAGRDVMTWMWPLRSQYFMPRMGVSVAAEQSPEPSGVEVVRQGETLLLRSAEQIAEIDARRGGLVALVSRGKRLELPGPRVLSASQDESSGGPPAAVRHRRQAAMESVEVVREHGVRRLLWSMRRDGWLRLSYLYEDDGKKPYHGIDFPFDQDQLLGLQWLGQGPSRVWANRREGAMLGLWQKERKSQTSAEWGHEPKLDGYYAGTRWARLLMPHGELHVAFEEPGIDLGILTPVFPEDSEEARAEVPTSGLGFFGEIPPIGTKFHSAETLQPDAGPIDGPGLARGVIWLRWQPRR